MSAGLDPRQVRRAFGRAAARYEANAVLQAEIGRRLREQLDAALEPQLILDVGCGPAAGALALHELWPLAQVIALDIALPMLRVAAGRAGAPQAYACVAGDAQALPLAAASVDLIHANLCLQWCDDPGSVMAEFRRVLRPGGTLVFSTFGPDTLHELRSAFAAVDAMPHVSRFIDMHDIGDGLLMSGFRDPVMGREDLTLTYSDLHALMCALRAIGATNADRERSRQLTGKQHLERVAAAYERFRVGGRLPATYEVVYARALAPDPGHPVRNAGVDVASFSLASLRGSRVRR